MGESEAYQGEPPLGPAPAPLPMLGSCHVGKYYPLSPASTDYVNLNFASRLGFACFTRPRSKMDHLKGLHTSKGASHQKGSQAHANALSNGAWLSGNFTAGHNSTPIPQPRFFFAHFWPFFLVRLSQEKIPRKYLGNEAIPNKMFRTSNEALRTPYLTNDHFFPADLGPKKKKKRRVRHVCVTNLKLWPKKSSSNFNRHINN